MSHTCRGTQNTVIQWWMQKNFLRYHLCKAYLLVGRMWRETSLLELRPLARTGWLDALSLAG